MKLVVEYPFNTQVVYLDLNGIEILIQLEIRIYRFLFLYNYDIISKRYADTPKSSGGIYER